MATKTSRTLVLFAWSLSVVVALLAVFAWAQELGHIGYISIYKLFPLIGLLAFSVMWSHYIVSVVRQHYKLDKSVTQQYFDTTSWFVLAVILLHPSLLIWQLWRDGFGLPPGSYERYVMPGLGWVTVLGTFSLFIFLTYEFRRRFSNRPWWRFVAYATDAAMLAILYHSLRLGGTLQAGWFHWIWLFYGVTLIASLIYIYSKKLSHKKITLQRSK